MVVTGIWAPPWSTLTRTACAPLSSFVIFKTRRND
jgi:hypothetical protein